MEDLQDGLKVFRSVLMPLLPNNRPDTSNIEAVRVLRIFQVHSLVA